MSYRPNEYFFVLSSEDQLPNKFFRGYGFTGANFVVGQAGLEAFSRQSNEAFEPGEDGCYILMRDTGDGHLVATDFKGYMKIFLYEHDGHWAFSNSFAKLIEFIKEKGWPFRPDFAQLDGWRLDDMIWQQFWSYNTAVEEIRLLPSNQYMMIRGNRIECRQVDYLTSLDWSLSYNEALYKYLSIWLGRLIAMIEHPALSMKADLTGGIDSRTVVSLFLGMRKMLGPWVDDHIRYHSGQLAFHTEDLRVAKDVAKTYDFALNTSPRYLKRERVRTSEEVYQVWKYLSLGSYSPVYFPKRFLDNGVVNFGGGGGEAHRPQYKADDLEDMILQFRGDFTCEEYFEKNFENIKSSIYENFEDESIDPLIRHWREFRDRFHHGLLPHHFFRLSPLASKHLYLCTELVGRDDVYGNRVIFDVMNTMMPGLARHPYDLSHKIPNSEIYLSLIGPMMVEPEPGKVFMDADELAPVADPKPRPPFERLVEDYRRFQPSAEGLINDSTRRHAERDLQEAAASKGFFHPREGRAAHNIMLAGLLGEG